MIPSVQHLIISRTDNLGDVLLTLPIAGYLKQTYPNLKISFIGKPYTKAIIDSCKFIDEFINKEEIIQSKKLYADAILFIFPDKEVAKIAWSNNIKYRIGTSNRIYHWLYCNKKIYFSRKKSELHEAQLNFKLLLGLGIDFIPSKESIPNWYGIVAPKHDFSDWLNPEKKHFILHPKSKGSAREWPIQKYHTLAQELSKNNYEVWVTGTEAEGKKILNEFPHFFSSHSIHNLTGKISLEELISFISQTEGIVACSTGPLHIAASLEKKAIGIYPPLKPIHPGRWAALGKKTQILVSQKECQNCIASQCACIEKISIDEVLKAIDFEPSK